VNIVSAPITAGLLTSKPAGKSLRHSERPSAAAEQIHRTDVVAVRPSRLQRKTSSLPVDRSAGPPPAKQTSRLVVANGMVGS